MKKFTLSLILFFLALFTVPSVFSNAQAATLKFDPTSGTAANGATFQVKVNADAGSAQVSAADVYVSFDPTLVKATLVTPGTYFADVTSNILNGKVYITGLPSQSDFTAFKTGAGTIATITFQALKNGTASLKFDCGTTAASSKIIQNDIQRCLPHSLLPYHGILHTPHRLHY